jgi:hypothetical protein
MGAMRASSFSQCETWLFPFLRVLSGTKVCYFLMAFLSICFVLFGTGAFYVA